MFALILSGLVALSIGRHSAQATLVNITVDDSYPANTGASILYAPPDTWSYGANCSYCSAKPDPGQAYNGTWRDVSWFPTSDATRVQTATLQFTGSGLYVFMIISTTSGAPDGGVHLTFTLDNEPAGSYDALGTPEAFVYNHSVYSNAKIPDGQHTFVLQNGGHANQSSLALLDYMVYTTNLDTFTDQPGSDGPKTSSSSGSAALAGTTPQAGTTDQSSPTGASTVPNAPAQTSGKNSHTHTRAIILAVVLTIVGVILIAAGMLWRYRRRRKPVRVRNSGGSPYGLDPFAGLPSQGGILREKGRETLPEIREESQTETGTNREIGSSRETTTSRETETLFEPQMSSTAQTRQEVETPRETHTRIELQTRPEAHTRIEAQTRPETQGTAISLSNLEVGSITPEVAPPSYEQALLERPRR